VIEDGLIFDRVMIDFGIIGAYQLTEKSLLQTPLCVNICVILQRFNKEPTRWIETLERHCGIGMQDCSFLRFAVGTFSVVGSLPSCLRVAPFFRSNI
jgi:hypothetical protein